MLPLKCCHKASFNSAKCDYCLGQFEIYGRGTYILLFAHRRHSLACFSPLYNCHTVTQLFSPAATVTIRLPRCLSLSLSLSVFHCVGSMNFRDRHAIDEGPPQSLDRSSCRAGGKAAVKKSAPPQAEFLTNKSRGTLL